MLFNSPISGLGNQSFHFNTLPAWCDPLISFQSMPRKGCIFRPQIIILILTAAVFGISVWGNIELRQVSHSFFPLYFLIPTSFRAVHIHSMADYNILLNYSGRFYRENKTNALGIQPGLVFTPRVLLGPVAPTEQPLLPF